MVMTNVAVNNHHDAIDAINCLNLLKREPIELFDTRILLTSFKY